MRPSSRHGIVETRYYSYVDGLRGVAILAVLAVHCAERSGPFESTLLSQFLSSGARGVQLFFILSSFTLFSSSRQRESTEPHPRRSFYVRRFFRIIPLWWLAICAFALLPAALQWVGPPYLTPRDAILHATFLYGFSPSHINSLVPGGWSLFCEETFYLILPVVHHRLRSTRGAFLLTGALVGVSAVWLLVGRAAHLDGAFRFFFPASQWFLFGIGILLYFVVEMDRLRMGPSLLRIADVATLAILGIAFGLALRVPPQYTAAVAWSVLCFLVTHRGSIWRRLIDIAPLRAFGRCCYSIYLFHTIAVVAVSRMLNAANWPWLGTGERRFLALYFATSAACLAAGLLSFNLFEKPFVRLGKKAIRSMDRASPEV